MDYSAIALSMGVACYCLFRVNQSSLVERISFELSEDLQHFRQYDTGPYHKEDVLPPFVNYFEEYRVAPGYNLSTCQIFKSMSTMRTGIFCLLFDAEGFLGHNSSTVDAKWHNSYCGSSNLYHSIKEVDSVMQPNYTNFVVIREPIDRFLSGFVHLCVKKKFCYGCGSNLRCFLEKQYARFRSQTKGVERRDKLLFQDLHFAPQTWFCSFSSRFSDYEIVKYGKGNETRRMSEDVLKILGKNNVKSHLIDIIKKELLKGKTYHSTSGSTSRQILEEELLGDSLSLSVLVKMYYFDFLVFGYPLPEIRQS